MVMWLTYLPIHISAIPCKMVETLIKKLAIICAFTLICNEIALNPIDSPSPFFHGIVDMTTFSGLTIYNIFTTVLDTQTNIQFILYLLYNIIYLSCIVHLLPWLSFWSKSLLPKLLDCPKPRMPWKHVGYIYTSKTRAQG